MVHVSPFFPPRRVKRKLPGSDDEDDALNVAPPKHLHASITWDVRAQDMAHHLFCTKFVTIMDTAIESQKWNVKIQKKCMDLMGGLNGIYGLYQTGTPHHELAKMFPHDPCFIRIMMLKVLFPPERIKRCQFLKRVVPPEYPGWDYTKDLYPPSQYPTSQSAEKELEAIKESIQGVDKLIDEIMEAVKVVKHKLENVTATGGVASKATKTRKMDQPTAGRGRV
ncbi:unnamed protein product [Clonostachys rhizophaga]|uniref:Uncharacterized protein n=1 Tax=Clonostachys rhizophaga TaxID=160324 RepID=A0A9N9V298_9HYPO|nr:unnamed protein product [Clonostachys rhizophaga]